MVRDEVVRVDPVAVAELVRQLLPAATSDQARDLERAIEVIEAL